MSGSPRGDALWRMIESVDPGDRDACVEELLGVRRPPALADAAPGDELIGYHASGVGAISLCVRGLELGPDQVLVDIGSGLGKVVLLANLLCGVRGVGIELQPELVALATERAAALGADVTFMQGDAREWIPEGDAYFMYLPFTGAALERVMERLEEHARRRRIVVCTLGLDLGRVVWLRAREPSDFWLSSYESR